MTNLGARNISVIIQTLLVQEFYFPYIYILVLKEVRNSPSKVLKSLKNFFKNLLGTVETQFKKYQLLTAMINSDILCEKNAIEDTF